jgi:mRNA-degrading endonuclease toxin of MazEF toxin-antitoxin module
LIISSSLYHAGRREAVIAAITSNTRRVLPGDQPLADWRQGGLLLPSLVTGIFGTVQTSAIRRRLGALTPNDMGSVNAAMRLALGL